MSAHHALTGDLEALRGVEALLADRELRGLAALVQRREPVGLAPQPRCIEGRGKVSKSVL